MKYPTIEEVNRANKIQLAKWVRFLPSPGSSAIGKDNFEETMDKENEILTLIMKLFEEQGGMNPNLSKTIGWNK